MTLKDFIAMFEYGTTFLVCEKIPDTDKFAKYSENRTGEYTYSTIPTKYENADVCNAKVDGEFPYITVFIRK